MKFVFEEHTRELSLKYRVRYEDGTIIDHSITATPPYITYTLENCDFTILADSNGVQVRGSIFNTINDQEGLDEIQTVLQWAYRQFHSLRDHGVALSQDSLTKELLA